MTENVPSFPERLENELGIQIIYIDLESDDWKINLFNSLDPPFIQSVREIHNSGQAPMERLLNFVANDLRAATAVIEPYISTDWNSEYSEIYSRTFADIPMRSQRIHFFRKQVDYNDLYSMSAELKKTYLGYTVIRPLEAFRVGDTVLLSPCCHTDHGGELVHCQENYKVSLLGNVLKIRGMPFIQQDTTVGVCAEADLWMVARYLNMKGEIGRYRPAEITELANATITTGPGREGLFELQMLDALRKMGLNPVVLYPKDAEEAKAFIYTCIESELPIITGVPGHVFVVIGHDYSKKKVNFQNGIVSISSAVNAFIVNDDSAGPYIRHVVGKVKGQVDRKRKKRELLTFSGKQVSFFMVAFPPRVHMNWQDAWDHTLFWVRNINSYARKILKRYNGVWSDSELKNLVTRTYLRLSRDFKRDLLYNNPEALRPKQIIEKYKSMAMPKYIWVTELAKSTDIEEWDPFDRKIRGEIILNSTGNRHVPDEALMAFNLHGKIFTLQPKAELIVEDDVPYSALKRPAIPQQ